MPLSLAAGLVVFLILFLLALPSPRCRCLMFALLHDGLSLLLAGVVLACLVFHVAPELAPPNLAAVLDRLLQRLEDHLPVLPLFRPLVSSWSILAVLAVAAGRPLLHRLEKASLRADRRQRPPRPASSR